MIFRCVASKDPPDRTCGKADGGAEPEGGTPSLLDDDPGKQRGREATARADSSKDESIYEAALLLGYPAGDKLICRWIDDRLTCAEGETYRHEECEGMRQIRGHDSGQRCGDAPPEDPKGEHPPGAKTRREKSGWQLESGVADEEGGEDPTKALIAQTKIAADRKTSDGDIRSIKEGDSAKNEEPEAQKPSDPRASATNHRSHLLSNISTAMYVFLHSNR